LIFKNELEKLESLSLSQSETLIDIIKYLYDSNIIHRDIRPNNLMFDRSSQHIKLIDLGFAITWDIKDKSKEVPIAGTITYADYEFLNFYSKTEHSTLWSRSYCYDKKFDSKCALNIIIYMISKTVRDELNSIEGLPSTENKIPRLLELWESVKNKNEKYSNLLTTINKLTRSSDFQKLKGQLKELHNDKIQ
jgi:serine/threonine protein kinase